MKALSFRQPWAELIVQGRKTMDLRTYQTAYRGPLAIHASQTVERDACAAHGLDPDRLETGGVVGIVQLVDIIPLDEAGYAAHRDAHLAGRSFRESQFGWVLADPQRLPALVPMRGRMSLFNVTLDGTPPSRRQPTAYLPESVDIAPEKPFTLTVEPDGAGSYALTLAQRILAPDAAPAVEGMPAALTPIVSLQGDNLKAVADHVIETLRGAGYKATDLSPERRRPFCLPEVLGVRLGLVFMAVKPLSKLRRVEAISHGIRQMPPEEIYYWYSKCTAADTAERAQKALRVLLAD